LKTVRISSTSTLGVADGNVPVLDPAKAGHQHPAFPHLQGKPWPPLKGASTFKMDWLGLYKRIQGVSRKRLALFSVMGHTGITFRYQRSARFIDMQHASCYSKKMEPQTFVIKSLVVQNGIMLFSAGIVLFFLGRAFVKKNATHVAVFLVWLGIVVWFFNSSFFGFSAVTVSGRGIAIDFGILSFRNTVLPLSTPWKIQTTPSGLLKTSKLYFIRLGDYPSMKVKGKKEVELLHRIGDAVEHARKRSEG
jgi:hypothetical protein